jgi:predicted nucleic acid-binding protein
LTFVIDASVTLAWAFRDEGGAYAEAVLKKLSKDNAVAPAIWPLELANALLVGERRGRLTQADTTRFHKLIRSLPIEIDEAAMGGAFDTVLPIARQHALSVYDACYVELALRMGCALATMDDRLRRAVSSVGVNLYSE